MKNSKIILPIIIGFVLLFSNYKTMSFVFVFAVIASTPYFFLKKSRSIDIFDPHITFSVLILLYSISTLTYLEINGETYYHEFVQQEDVITYQLCCLIGIIGFTAGKILACINSSMTSMRILVSSRVKYFKSERIIVYVGIFFFVAFIYFVGEKFIPWMATTYGDIALLVRVKNLENNLSGIKEIITVEVPLFYIIGACVVLIFTNNKRKSPFIFIAVLLLLAHLITTLLSGWRGQMMSILLMIAVYYNYNCKKISLRLAAFGSIIVYLLINFLSIMRGSSNPIEMVFLLIEAFKERGMDLLAISQSGELATSTNLLRLISGINNNETSFGYGLNAVNQLIAFLPRVIMPDRPPIASERFVQIFYPGIYESGGGYGFFILQDGYWDFGLFGTFFYSMVFAFAAQKIYLSYLKRAGHPFWTLIYGMIYYQLIFSSVRSGIFASIKAALIIVVPILIVYFIFLIFLESGTKKVKKIVY